MTSGETHCLSSLVPPENSTARAKATSRTIKKPVTPQKAFAIFSLYVCVSDMIFVGSGVWIEGLP